MIREQCKEGLQITFGRSNGERTKGTVVKCNPKKAKVRQDEARGQHPVGTIWSVPYSLIHAEGMKTAYPIGLTVAGIRYLTAEESRAEGWSAESVVAVVLSDGSLIYASQDYEGNGPGALFGKDSHGATFWITPATVGSV